MKRGRWILAMGLVVVLLLPGAVTGSSQPEAECEYFSETGHWVCGEFLDFFHTRGGLELFGYPLTEAFDDPMHGGLRVQYFQRARMEWHPSKPSPHKVLLGLLVDELAYDFPRAEQEQVSMASGPLHHYFPETQHVVSFAFLDYFRKQGGVDIFGYPRSEFMYESGRIVQYFQRARMEWHPESRGGPQMRLANLGEVYIEEFGLPGDYDDPVPPAARPDETVSGAYDFNQGDARLGGVATRLNLDASVQLVITGPKSLEIRRPFRAGDEDHGRMDEMVHHHIVRDHASTLQLRLEELAKVPDPRLGDDGGRAAQLGDVDRDVGR